MPFPSAYNIPLGVCVSCGGEIVGKKRNALYCSTCCIGRPAKNYEHVAIRVVTVGLMQNQLDMLSYAEEQGIIASRSEGVRQAINCWIQTFREPVVLTTAKLKNLLTRFEEAER